VERVPAPRRRRNHNFDLNTLRRSEIVRHARFVGAMATDDRSRWLIAWVWHNPEPDDQVYSVMLAFAEMNWPLTVLPTGNTAPWIERGLSEAEAIAIVDEAAEFGPIRNMDKLAKYLGLTYQQRTTCRVKTIGSIDVKKRARRVLRQRKDRLYRERKRRAAGMRPQSESLSATQPWRKRGMSRATWYRQNKPGMRRETVLSAITLYSPVDRVVSTERARMEFERGFASKEARGLPSSQTATTMVADSHEALPTELRLLALGLVETDWTKNLARAA